MEFIGCSGKVVSVYLDTNSNYVYKSNRSPVNPMHFRDGTPRFSLKGGDDWWDKGTCDRTFVLKSNVPVNRKSNVFRR